MTDTTNTLVIIPGDAISKAVQAYELPDEQIRVMREFCEKIAIAGPEDKANYKLATQAYSKVKKTRTAIEAKRKELKEPALEFGRAVDAEAKRLTALIEPVESALKAKIDVIDREKERQEQERRNHLHNEMITAGYKFQSGVYVVGNMLHSQQQVWDATQAQIVDMIQNGLAEVRRIEAEQAELDRLRKLAEEAEARKVVEAIKEPNIPNYVEYPNEGTPHTSMAPNDPFANIPSVLPPQKQEPIAPASTSTTPIEDFRPGYIEGFNAAKVRIIEILESPEKLTRAQWIDKIGRMKP